TQRGGSIPREVLLANLWPDMPEEAARHNLYTAVHNLRRCLEPNLKRATDSRYVLYDDYSYRLNGGIAHWVDAQAFETGIRHARHEPALARATALYADALSLYHGDFLSHLGNTIGWHWQEQERLRTLYLHALEAYAGLLVRQQQLDAACQALEIVLAQDPCRETACYLLMQARWQQGQRALALASYQRLSAALQTELGVSPEAQTRAFYVRIANGA
ncbi:MAG: hypothetical protein KC425_25550, partial [Anaerolineales bacterium]|nr:hypothetical protein [Anaerolineales bacterium]